LAAFLDYVEAPPKNTSCALIQGIHMSAPLQLAVDHVPKLQVTVVLESVKQLAHVTLHVVPLRYGPMPLHNMLPFAIGSGAVQFAASRREGWKAGTREER
jgi:hypothetical protein